jgi:hypothetical protein
MEFYERIRLLDELPFLKKINLTYHQITYDQAAYYVGHKYDFKFHIYKDNRLSEYCKITPSKTLYMGFEQFFDELPEDLKEAVIFNLNLFRG